MIHQQTLVPGPWLPCDYWPSCSDPGVRNMHSPAKQTGSILRCYFSIWIRDRVHRGITMALLQPLPQSWLCGDCQDRLQVSVPQHILQSVKSGGRQSTLSNPEKNDHSLVEIPQDDCGQSSRQERRLSVKQMSVSYPAVSMSPKGARAI